MKTVTITMEKVTRASRTFTISDEEYDAIVTDGICPRQAEMEQALAEVDTEYLQTNNPENGDVEFDYSIIDDEDRELVSWD